MATIHLADRDAAYRSRLARALRQARVDVLEFASGSELYAQTLEAAPDLVVMETDLDDADGFQVFQWLHGRRQSNPPPVVFLTGFEHPGIARVCKERGARDFIGKARALDAVVDRVLTVLGERDPLSGRSLAAALAWLQSRGKSGRLEAQACGRTGTILLHHGRVVGAQWDTWQGEDALRLLTEVHSASRFRFVEGIEEMMHPDAGLDAIDDVERVAPTIDLESRESSEAAGTADPPQLEPQESPAALPAAADSAGTSLQPDEPAAPDEETVEVVDDGIDGRSRRLPAHVGAADGLPAPSGSADGLPAHEDAHLRSPTAAAREEGPPILIARPAYRTHRRDVRVTLPLIAAGIAVVLTAGLTIAALFERQQAGGVLRPQAAAESGRDPARVRVPRPLSIADAAGEPIGRNVRDERETAVGATAEPAPAAERRASLPSPRPPAAEAPAVSAPRGREASPAESAPAAARQRPSPVAPERPTQPARAIEPPSRSLHTAAVPTATRAPALPVAALEVPAPAAAGPGMPAPELLVVEADPAATDPVEVARREVERRHEVAQLERDARSTRLDAAPAPKQPVRFRYPRGLADQKVRGSVELLVHLDATGAVKDVRVLQSSGSRALDRVAAEAIRRASYQPPRRDGVAVSAWIRQPLVGMCCREDSR